MRVQIWIHFCRVDLKVISIMSSAIERLDSDKLASKFSGFPKGSNHKINFSEYFKRNKEIPIYRNLFILMNILRFLAWFTEMIPEEPILARNFLVKTPL